MTVWEKVKSLFRRLFGLGSAEDSLDEGAASAQAAAPVAPAPTPREVPLAPPPVAAQPAHYCEDARTAEDASVREPAVSWLASFDRALLDAHCHVHHAADLPLVAAMLEAQNMHAFCMTETPQEYERFAPQVDACSALTLAPGLHPWSIASSEQEVCAQCDALEPLIAQTRLVGEVGLDFSLKHAENEQLQRAAFTRIARACAQMGGKVLSIHAVQSADAALDILEETGCLETCVCIFHWFSGSGEALVRARDAGCYFSVGDRMLISRRGFAYALQLPRERILVETDAYPDESFDLAGYASTFSATVRRLKF